MQIGGRGFKVEYLWRTSPKNSNKSFQGLDYSASDTYHVGKSVNLVLSSHRVKFYSDPENVTESHMVESLKAFVLHICNLNFWSIPNPSFRFDPTFKDILAMHRCSHTINIKQILFEFCLSAPSHGICPMFYSKSPNPAVAAISMKFFDCFYHRLDMAAWSFKIYILRLWILSFLFFRDTCKCILRSKLAKLFSLFATENV